MKERQKLFIDFDDTLALSSKRFCELYNYIYENDRNFEPANYKINDKWDFSLECPLLKKYGEYTVEDLFGMKEFFNGLELQPMAYEVAKELNQKYELYIVSVGTMSNLQYKSEYISDKLPFIDNIILLYNKDCKMNKSIVATPKDSIFLDDVLSNLLSVSSQYKYIYGVEKPWNIEGINYGCKRLYDYIDVGNEFLK